MKYACARWRTRKLLFECRHGYDKEAVRSWPPFCHLRNFFIFWLCLWCALWILFLLTGYNMTSYIDLFPTLNCLYSLFSICTREGYDEDCTWCFKAKAKMSCWRSQRDLCNLLRTDNPQLFRKNRCFLLRFIEWKILGNVAMRKEVLAATHQ